MSGGGPGNEVHSGPLPGVGLYVPHRFRIEWTPSVIRYYVDGALGRDPQRRDRRRSCARSSATTACSAPSVRVDWLRMSTYATSGTFLSRTLDSGPGANDWQGLTSQSVRPSGTAISFETRSGADALTGRGLVRRGSRSAPAARSPARTRASSSTARR